MKIIDISAIHGPNVFHDRPVLRATINLENLTEIHSADCVGFVDRLLELFPGLREHHCSLGRPGGFVERLERGTYFAHIVEHVAIELTHLAGIPVNYGKTVYAGLPGLYVIAITFTAEEATKHLLMRAVDLVDDVVAGGQTSYENIIKKAERLAIENELGPSTRMILRAAELRGIPWRRLDDQSLVQLGTGKYRKFIQATESSKTSSIAADVAKDKSLTKRLLSAASIPVPSGAVASTVEEAIEIWSAIGVPVALKPVDGSQGRCVSLNVNSEEGVRHGFKVAQSVCRHVMIEEYFVGRDYRIVTVEGKVVAASERRPAHVIGDGESTVAQLIDKENLNPLRSDCHSKPLSYITIDDDSSDTLREQGFALDSVPPRGARVLLHRTANLSTGGTARDVTDEVHPDIIKVCERAARAIELDICGVDLIAPDISKPLPPRGAGIIELNSAPGIRMHHFPLEGKARDVGGAIVDMLYPAGQKARIPVIAVTGTNGKTTTTRLIARAFDDEGFTVGCTTTDGILIGKSSIREGDTTGPLSTQTVLSDPTVEIAVLEVARGGILKGGLGYDWSDVGVVLNVQPDHLGCDGLETVEDLLHVKSLIAERVRPGGTIVLNADDPMSASLASNERVLRHQRAISFFSAAEQRPPELDRHIEQGGAGYYLVHGVIVENKRGFITRLCDVRNIPLTLGGLSQFAISNVLAAVASCRALGLDAQSIASTLKSFELEQNSGRMNAYEVNGGIVVVDYAHNAHAIEAIARTARNIKGRKLSAVVTVPGDRSNTLIRDAAVQAAAYFDKIIIREDADTRGRKSGEVATLMWQTVKFMAPDQQCEIILDEGEALTRAIESLEPDEIVFHFYERKSVVLEVLKSYDATAVRNWQVLVRGEQSLEVESRSASV